MRVLLKWQKPKFEFRYPMTPVPRTAILEPWFQPTPGESRIQAFHADELSSLADFQPQALAASWGRLMRLLDSTPFKQAAAPTHAVVVLHRQSSSPLSCEARERLWRAFRVPVFEQVIGARGELLATECGMHDGLHVESTRYQFDDEVDHAQCLCGKTTPRLRIDAPEARFVTAAQYVATL